MAEPSTVAGGAVEAEVGLDWSDGARAAEAMSSEPLLGRAEIRALLRGEEGASRPGVLALVESGAVVPERLPMLEVVLDRLQDLLASSLRPWSAGAVELAREAVGAQRFGEHLASLPRPTPIAVVRAVEWDGPALVTLDRGLVAALVDLLLGGRRAGTLAGGEARPLTSIEAALVERFVRLVLADLGRAFEPVAPVSFELERIESEPRFATITRPANACLVLRLRVALDGRGGILALLLPYPTLEPAREALVQPFTGEKLGRDPIWERHLAHRIRVAGVRLEAVLEGGSVTLRQLLGLRPGSILPLAAGPDAPVVLRCRGVPLLSGRLGRVGDRVSVRIEERIAREQEG